MSQSYFLVCLNCKSGVSLGKAVAARYDDKNVDTFGFQDLGSSASGSWEPDANHTAKLQHFLMLHRGHELRVLSSAAGKFAMHEDVPQSYPVDDSGDPNYNVQSFFEAPVTPPDPDSEPDSLPLSVIERLKEF